MVIRGFGVFRRGRQRPLAERGDVTELGLAALGVALAAVEVEQLGLVLLVVEVRPGLAGEHRAQLAVGMAHTEHVRGIAAAALDVVRARRIGAVEVHLEEGLELAPIGRRPRLDVEARLPGVEMEVTALVGVRGVIARDRRAHEAVAQELVEVVDEVGFDVAVDGERRIRARKLEGAREVAADDRVRGCRGLCALDRRLLLLEPVETRLKRVDLGLQVVRLAGERRACRQGKHRARAEKCRCRPPSAAHFNAPFCRSFAGAGPAGPVQQNSGAVFGLALPARHILGHRESYSSGRPAASAL